MLTFGSLFAGIGGFDLGLERAGLRPIFQCEIDKDCQKVLKRHWPDVRLYNDVKEINKSNTASPDVLVGGFPCQDLSVAGKRTGLAGERSGLWFEFHRVIADLKPRWVVIENVPGLLSSESGRDFAVILRGLAECGYYAAWRVLDAQYFGVAQRRRRVFIVASLDGSCAEILFESEGGAWDSPPSREKGERIAATITKRFGGASNQRPPINEADNLLPVAATLGQRMRGQDDSMANNLIAFGGNNTKGSIEVATAVNAGHGSRRYDFESETFIAATSQSGGNGNRPSSRGEHLVWEMSHADEAVRINGDTAPTLQQRMGTGGNQVPMVGVRRLTPTECERLQGFPDGYTEGQSDSARYRQIGNAVAVPCSEWIGRRIVAVTEE